MKKNMSWPRILIAGALYAIVAWIVHTLGAIASMKYYLMPEYFAVWSKIMMPAAGPPPLSFTLYSLTYSLIGGILFALVYNIVKDSVKKKSAVKTGLYYGLLVFAVAGIPSLFMLHLLINLPSMLIVAWGIENIAIYLTAGMITAKINR